MFPRGQIVQLGSFLANRLVMLLLRLSRSNQSGEPNLGYWILRTIPSSVPRIPETGVTESAGQKILKFEIVLLEVLYK
jgi:hypothetical protein